MKKNKEDLEELLHKKEWRTSTPDQNAIIINKFDIDFLIVLFGEESDKYNEWMADEDGLSNADGKPKWVSASGSAISPVSQVKEIVCHFDITHKFIVLIDSYITNVEEYDLLWRHRNIVVISYDKFVETINSADLYDFEADEFTQLKTDMQDIGKPKPKKVRVNKDFLWLKLNARMKTIEHIIEDIQESREEQLKPSDPNKPRFELVCCQGSGFAGVAGMESLKAQFTNDIINCLKKRDVYERYKLRIPNGFLFYGPPGCGKSFFARQLAQEIDDANLICVTPADINSLYVNHSAERLNALFSYARDIAESTSDCTIVFIDEIDGLLMNRNMNSSHQQSALVVNEFLALSTDPRNRDIIIIGATNRVDIIDPAVLRSGRLENKIYIPLPDFDARRELFKITIADRPVDDTIDCDALSTLTDGYVSSDIKLIVERACRYAIAEGGVLLSQSLLTKVIGDTPPSVSSAELKNHEAIHRSFSSKGNTNRRIGF